MHICLSAQNEGKCLITNQLMFGHLAMPLIHAVYVLSKKTKIGSVNGGVLSCFHFYGSSV